MLKLLRFYHKIIKIAKYLFANFMHFYGLVIQLMFRFKSLKARCAGTEVVFCIFSVLLHILFRGNFEVFYGYRKITDTGYFPAALLSVEDAVIDISSTGTGSDPGGGDNGQCRQDGYAGAGGSAGGIQFKSRRNAAPWSSQFRITAPGYVSRLRSPVRKSSQISWLCRISG